MAYFGQGMGTGTSEYNRARVHSHKYLEMDPAKINLLKK